MSGCSGIRGVYDGELVDGIPNGKGSSINVKGVRYSGEWKNGLYHGNGKVTLPCGETYEGGFEKGLRHGKGVITRDGISLTYTFHYGLEVKPAVLEAIKKNSKHL